MIDDSLYNYKRLKEQDINVILFDDNNVNINIKERISNWKEKDKYL